MKNSHVIQSPLFTTTIINNISKSTDFTMIIINGMNLKMWGYNLLKVAIVYFTFYDILNVSVPVFGLDIEPEESSTTPPLLRVPTHPPILTMTTNHLKQSFLETARKFEIFPQFKSDILLKKSYVWNRENYLSILVFYEKSLSSQILVFDIYCCLIMEMTMISACCCQFTVQCRSSFRS